MAARPAEISSDPRGPPPRAGGGPPAGGPRLEQADERLGGDIFGGRWIAEAVACVAEQFGEVAGVNRAHRLRIERAQAIQFPPPLLPHPSPLKKPPAGDSLRIASGA